MYWLLDQLNNLFRDPTIVRWVVVLISAVACVAFGLGIAVLISNATSPIRRRLGLVESRPESDGRRTAITIASIIGPISSYVLPTNGKERESVRKRLSRAGYRSPEALQVFFATKVVLAISLTVIAWVATQWFPRLTSLQTLTVVFSSTALGLFLPSIVLDRMQSRRIRRLRNGFPDALDLLVVCVESGLGLAAAIQRVSNEIGVSHPDLAFELGIVNAEIRASIERETALKNLAERTGLSDIRGLVSLLVQTLRFGTSVADTLRVYSEEFRDKRMQDAEERAAKMGTKMIFPLVVCLFPGFFMIAVGPAALALSKVFGDLFGN